MGFFEWLGYCVIAGILTSGFEAIGAGIRDLARAIRDTSGPFEMELDDEQ